MFRLVLDRCPTLEGDMRFVMKSAKARLAMSGSMMNHALTF